MQNFFLNQNTNKGLIKMQEENTEFNSDSKDIDLITQIDFLQKHMKNLIKNSANTNKNFVSEIKEEKNNLQDFDFSNIDNINDFFFDKLNYDENKFLDEKKLEDFSKENNEIYVNKLIEIAIKNNTLKHKTNDIKKENVISNHNDINKSNNIIKHENDNLNKTENTETVIKEPKKNLRKNDKLENLLIKNNYSDVVKLDDKIEEELNNEILNYTKNMKKYANSFNEVLSKDNRTLNKIEKTQIDGKIKTDTQMKKLDEFNYQLKIGFFKMLFMFLFVFFSFIFSIIMIRFLPKIA